MRINPLNSYDRTINVASDKSITHRAILFNALANGKATITNALLGDDCSQTIECCKAMGSKIEVKNTTITMSSNTKSNQARLYVGNSGTTIRLLTGALASMPNFYGTITGDESIERRPMRRILEPLGLMGAKIDSRGGNAPLTIYGRQLCGISYNMPVASAQVKSCILLAGLSASSTTTITEKTISRDHTEIMLARQGANIVVKGGVITLQPSKLSSCNVHVPSDISSAVFAMVAAACTKGGKVVLPNVGVNPTRTGCLDILRNAGARVDLEMTNCDGESAANITVTNQSIQPFIISGNIIPRLIDEIPALAVLACFAEGRSIIKDAGELAVKESNRIVTVVAMLKSLGASITATSDGMIIDGKGYLDGGGVVDAGGDHRIAMSGAVAMALSRKGGELVGGECVKVSYPEFFVDTIC